MKKIMAKILSAVLTFELVASILVQTPIQAEEVLPVEIQLNTHMETTGANLLTNPEFEAGVWAADSWADASDLSVTTDASLIRQGQALQMNNETAAIQVVSNLEPNTLYLLEGYLMGDKVWLGAQDFGDVKVQKYTTSGTYAKQEILFKTGAASTSAKVFIYKENSTGSSYADSMSLKKVSNVINHALGKSADSITVTSSEGGYTEGSHPKENANDGDLGTRWTNYNNATWSIDLGKTVDLYGVELRLEGETSSYKVSTSSDNSNWTEQINRNNFATGDHLAQEVFTQDITARYVRFDFYDSWPSCYEIMVYGLSESGEVTAVDKGTVVVDPAAQYQTFEGWGTSLAWFANIIGGWSAEKRQEISDLLFDPVKGLGFNIVRYNIGGGDDPAHEHMRTGGEMDGFSTGFDGQGNLIYNWNVDQNQIAVLKDAITRGANVVEAFSNTPPYFMTNSGCASGTATGWENNLKDENYDDFANYLTEVVKHFRDVEGITFTSLEPLNEPYTNYWKINGGQEGAHFDRDKQELLIHETYQALATKQLPTYLSAMDESNMDTGITSFLGYNQTTRDQMTRLNIHSYSGSGRMAVKYAAEKYNKPLWMSEVDLGGGAYNPDSILPGLAFSDRINDDLLNMQPNAWVMWQAVENWSNMMTTKENSNWGLIFANLEGAGTYEGQVLGAEDYKIGKKYYTMMQYSKFIKAGYQMIGNNDANDNVVTFYSAADHKLVIVAQNSDATNNRVAFDVSGFTTVGTQAQAYRTSNSENCVSTTAVPVVNGVVTPVLMANSITTYVIDNVTYDNHVVKINDSQMNTTGVGFEYSGDWNNTYESNAYSQDNSWTGDSSATYKVHFSGKQIQLYGATGPNHGIGQVSIDGSAPVDMDLYSASRIDGALLYVSPVLSEGTHTVTVSATTRKNPNAGGTALVVDSATVFNGVSIGVPHLNLAPASGAAKKVTMTLTPNETNGGVGFEYKLGPNGVWTTYLSPVVVVENTLVAARAIGANNERSEEVVNLVGNIDLEENASTIFNGTLFADTEGNPINAHGGSLIKAEDGFYYWYGEHRDPDNYFLGVGCYRSSDLKTWTNMGDALTKDSHPELAKVWIERPKVIYNETTHQYVMWMHWENGVHYGHAKAAVAYCSTPDGDFTYTKSFRPLYQQNGLYDTDINNEGDQDTKNQRIADYGQGYMSRDCTLFVDDDGSAYFISASSENATLNIYKLSSDYLEAVSLEARIFENQHREAPCVLKKDGKYYLVTSGTSGWSPNQGKYAYSDSLASGWSDSINWGDWNNYASQPAYVLPIEGTEGTTYLYTGDRWGNGFGESVDDSQYVWLPITFKSPTDLRLEFSDTIQIYPQNGLVKQSAVTGFMFVNRGSGKALSVEGASLDDGGNVAQFGAIGLNEQLWNVSYSGNGGFEVENLNSGKLMGVDNGSTEEGANVLQWFDGDWTSQNWKLVDVGNGYYQLTNINSGKVLETVNGSVLDNGNVVQKSSSNSLWQQWQIVGINVAGEIPTMAVTPLTANQTQVTVNLTTSSISLGSSLEFKLGSTGIWTTYTTPVAITQNMTIYGRTKGLSGAVSEVAQVTVGNIVVPNQGGNNNNPIDTNVSATIPNVPNPVVDNIITKKPDIQTSTDGQATQFAQGEISTSELEQAFISANNQQSVIIDMTTTQKIGKTEITMPAEVLTGSMAGNTQGVLIKTDVAEVTLPPNMLGNNEATAGQKVSLVVEKLNETQINTLSSEAQQMIGSRPVINLQLWVNGVETAWKNEAAEVTVQIPYTPSADELETEYLTVYYLPANGIPEPMNARFINGQLVFKTTHFSQYAVVYGGNRFVDLKNTLWAQKAVEILANKGIIKGTGNNTFSPKKTITRAEFITLIVKTFGLKQESLLNFSDVNQKAYYYEAIGTAKALGIVKGTGANLFNPNAHITREDMMVMVSQALKVSGISPAKTDKLLSNYKDQTQISAYAKAAVQSLVEAGLVNGSGEKIAPKSFATRAETAVLLYKLYNLQK